MDEEASQQHQPIGSSCSPAQPYLRPLGLRLRKSASLLEWLNKKLSEQGRISSNVIRCLAMWMRPISVSRIVVKSPSIGRDNMCTTACHPRSSHQGLLSTGEACSVGSESFHATPQPWASRGGAQDAVTLQAVQRAPSVTSKSDSPGVKLKDHKTFFQCHLCLQLSVLCFVCHNRISCRAGSPAERL